jgi:hypothetical protein
MTSPTLAHPTSGSPLMTARLSFGAEHVILVWH